MLVYAVARDVLAEQYRLLVHGGNAGDIQLEVEPVPLASVADAWRR
jgi:hypothetical protein